jgi:hypothetical protein
MIQQHYVLLPRQTGQNGSTGEFSAAATTVWCHYTPMTIGLWPCPALRTSDLTI